LARGIDLCLLDRLPLQIQSRNILELNGTRARMECTQIRDVLAAEKFFKYIRRTYANNGNPLPDDTAAAMERYVADKKGVRDYFAMLCMKWLKYGREDQRSQARKEMRDLEDRMFAGNRPEPFALRLARTR